VEAVESGRADDIRSELGDVLFQVVFLAQLYAEQGDFNLAEVIDQATEKMTRRHPHVFGDEKLDTAEEVKGLWGRIKSRERGGGDQGLLDSVPRAAPALIRAHRLGQRAARVGFDWSDADQVWDQAGRETAELARAEDLGRAEEELGDVLFTWAQWARRKGLGAEAALRKANARFCRRFSAMEQLARDRGLDLEGMGLAEMNALWEEVKLSERSGPAGPPSRKEPV
jgi:MazG family protein